MLCIFRIECVRGGRAYVCLRLRVGIPLSVGYYFSFLLFRGSVGVAESFTAYSWWWQTRIYTHTHTNVRKGTKKKKFQTTDENQQNNQTSEKKKKIRPCAGIRTLKPYTLVDVTYVRAFRASSWFSLIG